MAEALAGVNDPVCPEHAMSVCSSVSVCVCVRWHREKLFMLISILRYLLHYSRAKVIVADITRNSAECVQNSTQRTWYVSVCLAQFLQLYRYTLGQTVLTETGRDNRSPGILFCSTLSLYASIVGQWSPLKIIAQSHYSVPGTHKKESPRLSRTCVTACKQIPFDWCLFDHTDAFKVRHGRIKTMLCHIVPPACASQIVSEAAVT